MQGAEPEHRPLYCEQRRAIHHRASTPGSSVIKGRRLAGRRGASERWRAVASVTARIVPASERLEYPPRAVGIQGVQPRCVDRPAQKQTMGWAGRRRDSGGRAGRLTEAVDCGRLDEPTLDSSSAPPGAAFGRHVPRTRRWRRLRARLQAGLAYRATPLKSTATHTSSPSIVNVPAPSSTMWRPAFGQHDVEQH
jgi:hypothetical protein